MRATLVWLLLLLLAVTIFALSNTAPNAAPVIVKFLQWPVYTGSLALAIVGAGVLGALLTLLPALVRQSHLGGRIRELEREIRTQEPAPRPGPTGPGGGYAPGPPSSGPAPSGRVEDTRRFP